MITETVPFLIPYEQQNYAPSTRQCGAACLRMVYQSFEKVYSQAEIWAAIAKEDRFGTIAARTYLMTQDALTRGFRAVAVQTSMPIQALQNCCKSGMRVILNHLLELGKPGGHYSVLVNVDDKYVYLHDPLLGPARRLSHTDLLQLWMPHGPESEIAGHVLIGVSACGPDTASKTECPACKSPVMVPPAALFACVNICPACDHAWPCNGKTESLATKFDLSQAFGQLDKFSGLLKSMPGMAEHAELKTQLDALARHKENIVAAVQAFEKHQKLGSQQLAAMQKSAKEAEEAHARKLAELKTPMAELDGHALGLALMKSLGFRATGA